MGDTKIGWTDKTWNPVRGCSVVSAGCENCYAMGQAHRFSGPGKAYEGLTRLTGHGPKWTGQVRLVPELLDQPLRWRKPKRIFVNSMSDLFHEDVPDEFIAAVFGVMALAHRHTFQVLTKRTERMCAFLSGEQKRGWITECLAAAYLAAPNACDIYTLDARRAQAAASRGWPLPNVWLGVSVENQKAADERIPELLETPAALRFVSCEPLLGPIDLNDDEGNWLHVHPYPNPAADGYIGKHVDRRLRCSVCEDQKVIDWVIAGGESGPGARPCNVEWIRSIVAQCREATVPTFVKQMGRCLVGDPSGFLVGRYLLADGSVFLPLSAGKRGAVPLGNAIGFSLFDSKGGVHTEWPQDLRVQEFPNA